MGSRATTQGYGGADGLRKQFTSKERDNETGLDYFLARYYSSGQGRFISPDEFTGGPDELFDFANDASANPTFYADLTNPQSLNKYQYTYNNPLRYIDPDGHDPEPQGDCCSNSQSQPTLGPAPPVPYEVSEQTINLAGRVADAIFEPIRQTETVTVIRQIIGTTPVPEVGPNDIPPVEVAQTGTPPQPQAQPLPPPPPAKAEHTKGKRKSTKDKHEKVRPGKKQPPNYKPFRKPPPKPKSEPPPPAPKPTPKPEIGPDGNPANKTLR